jgi:membrane-bound serine protease (ClpP class)
LLVLWWLGVPLTWLIFLLVFLFFIASAFIVHRLVIPVYRRQVTTGREGLIGQQGRAVESLALKGLIKVNGEYWKAESIEGIIGKGEKIRVAGYENMVLKVQRLASPGIKRYDSNNTSNF